MYKKTINGKPYYYLREMGWVDGKPKLVSERYLGSAADIVASMDAVEAAVRPARVLHLESVTSPRCGRCWPIWMWSA